MSVNRTIQNQTSNKPIDEESMHDLYSSLFWPIINRPFGSEAIIFMHALTMSISIPGNLLTALMISYNRSLREEPAYLIICSVSCADFMVSIIAQPLNIYALTQNMSNLTPAYELVLYFSIWGFCGASAFGVVFITFDRFLCINYPMHYTRLLDRKRTGMLIGVQWICGMAYGALPLIDIKESAFPTAIASLITIMVMTLAMFFIYNKVYENINRLNKNVHNQNRSKQRQNNATFTIALIVLAFFVCWFPYIVTNFILTLREFSSTSPVNALYYWFLGLGCWNSALNVIIYGFKNSTLKREARKWLNFKRISPFYNTSDSGTKKNINSRSINIIHGVAKTRDVLDCANGTLLSVPSPRVSRHYQGNRDDVLQEQCSISMIHEEEHASGVKTEYEEHVSRVKTDHNSNEGVAQLVEMLVCNYSNSNEYISVEEDMELKNVANVKDRIKVVQTPNTLQVPRQKEIPEDFYRIFQVKDTSIKPEEKNTVRAGQNETIQQGKMSYQEQNKGFNNKKFSSHI